MSTPEEAMRHVAGLVDSGWSVTLYRHEAGSLIWPVGTRYKAVAAVSGERGCGDEIVGIGVTMDSAIDNLVGQMREQGNDDAEGEDDEP